MKAITAADVERAAELARIALTDEEKARAAHQLTDILQAFARLDELDVAGVEPMPHAVPLKNVLRDDRARPSWPKPAMLANAPDEDQGFFRVPRVMEE
ncbi:MAG TPA: Asp-tRNA(Asn)/Glu-tRNA(Gln) amidotransferase subunit GatC [Limnochordia bacterium]|nr:Asp-tRNA(Asn)/Glu-tRNA(Gln) amidotransferase subunit GatC [Limnochordia bacterium]